MKTLPSYHVSHMYHLNTEHVMVNVDIWVVVSSPLVYLSIDITVLIETLYISIVEISYYITGSKYLPTQSLS